MADLLYGPLPSHVPLAITTRGNGIENIHSGSVAVVNEAGDVLASAGDPLASVFTRSTIKPFQALPFVAAGGLERFGWGTPETALLCASHSAEEAHLAVVRRMLQSAGVDEGELGCGVHVPTYYATVGKQAPQQTWTALHNNCSGKHTGFLACCALHGWSHADYLDPQHPLQVDIRAALGDVAGVDVDSLPSGVDGCIAPNYALPLARLATLFARLAAGRSGTRWDCALVRLRDAMRAEPLLVSGTARFDWLLAQAGKGDWLAKVGADGVQVISSISRGIGIAIKLADGNNRVLNTVAVDLLQQLGWIDKPLPPGLANWSEPAIRNWQGTATGHVASCLRLHCH